MQHAEYEKALLVAAAFQLAKSDDVNELLAITCVIRNWVVPRMGEKQIYRSYTEAIAGFLTAYAPLRSIPAIDNPALIDPEVGLLHRIDDVYNNTAVDVTSSHNNPRGARYFTRAAHSLIANNWIVAEVLLHPELHPLIGTWGAQQFYA